MKNLLFILAMLCTSSAVFSQLYVSKNGTTDHYIYVDDEVLFVEQDINLVKNNTGDTEASIYLRNQAQLVQGTTSSSNLGTGLISVFQNSPDDDSWDYSFWSSPVNNQTLGVSGNQKYGILRIHDTTSVITNSVVTQTYGGYNGVQDPLKISTRWMYRYPAGGPWNPIYTNDEIDPGYGFIMKGVGTTNHDQNYDFRGRPNNGDMTVAVLTSKYTLSGNPYPSALDLNRVFYDPDNSEINSIKYWDEDRSIDSHYHTDNKGGYGIWVPGASDPNGSNPGTYTVAPFLNYDQSGGASGGQTGTGSSWERRFAPIGQGFMIYGDSDGDIIIKNEHRRYIPEGFANGSEYRSQEEAGDDPANSRSRFGEFDITPLTPQVRIYTTFGDSHFRDMVLIFSDDATDGYDRGFDALHPMDGVGADAYFPIGEDTNREKYVIQGVQFEIEKLIPIAFSLNQQTSFTVKAVEVINLNDRPVLLYDQEENTYMPISGGHEAFLNLPAGDYNDRFFIRFKGQEQVYEESEGTAILERVQKSVEFYQNNPYKQMEIKNPDRYNIQSALVYDMSGKLVVNRTNIGTENRFNISTANLADGVYIIKLTTSENIDIDYRMIIQNR